MAALRASAALVAALVFEAMRAVDGAIDVVAEAVFVTALMANAALGAKTCDAAARSAWPTARPPLAP